MSDDVVWRVVALATPPWVRGCTRCLVAAVRFDATDRFRVNANGARLDVWLLYACARCGTTGKRRLLQRVPVASIERARLDGYQRDDPALARAHAFELPVSHELPHRVERPALPAGGVLHARIAQEYPCGLRWDRLLAHELGWSRARTLRAWRCGGIAIEGARAPADRIGDGQRLRASLD